MRLAGVLSRRGCGVMGKYRSIPAILLTTDALLVVLASCLPWGSLELPDGWKTSYNGWEEPMSIARGVTLPNWLVSAAVSSSALLIWLRSGWGMKMPWIVPLVLTAYSCGHVAWFFWFFDSGQAVTLSSPRSVRSWVGSGVYVAGVACASAFVVCVFMLVVPCAFSKQDRKRSDVPARIDKSR